VSNALEPERGLAEGGTVGPLLSLVLAAVASFGAIAFLRRPRLGRFVVTTDDERSFSFVTDTGRFRVELEKRELTLRDILGATRSIPLDQIERLDFAHAERLELIDADAERMHWLTLWLVLEGGERLLVYAIGQLEPREPWLERIFALETAWLARLGLFRDIEHPARKVLERIQPRLEDPAA